MLTEFEGKVAVITGAAGGFGLAMAHKFGKEGMNLVLADIDDKALAHALEEIKQYDTEAIAVTTDVGNLESVMRLADITFDRFPVVHLLINNAGVSSIGPVWETSMEDWKRVFDINFFGIVHGLQAFLKRMMGQDFPSHIVNTASAAGLLAPPGLSVYNASKHAATALSETLFADLRLVQSPVGVSLLCPAWVKTGIAGKPDPEAFSNMSDFTKKAATSVMNALNSSTVTADDVAEATFQAVLKGEFYILTHLEVKEDFMKRANRINNGQVPYMDGL